MSVVVVGGTGGLGQAVARHYLAAGREVVITGRDPERAGAVAGELGGSAGPPPLGRGLRSATPAGGGAARGVGLELTAPERVGPALAGIGPVDHLVLAAIDRGSTTIDDFEAGPATALAILKLAGYLAVVHALRSRLSPDSSVLIFGGQARVRPYPGSTMVSTVNGGVVGMVRTLSVELAPVRVNAIHPGIVGDSPFWAGKPEQVLETFRSGTLTGRLATLADVVSAVAFLLENPSVNGVDLVVDGGWR